MGAPLGVDVEVLALPTAEGKFRRFEITPSIVMAPELQAKFPQIRTYEGRAVDGSPSSVRLETGPNGFGAMTFVADVGVQMIELDAVSGLYLTYSRERYLGTRQGRCLTQSGFRGGPQPMSAPAGFAAGSGPEATGPTLRTYRTAIGATGEYTAFFGGTVVNGLAAIVTAVNQKLRTATFPVLPCSMGLSVLLAARLPARLHHIARGLFE